MTKPNIIMILADDMGFSDIGCYGGEIATPNLDSLADHGVRMAQYYTTPRCSPSRASFLTGRHPHETGIGVLTADDGPGGYPGSIDPAMSTISERLRDAGYATCLSGKWHLSADVEHPNDSWPTRRGFDSFFGVLAGTVSYYQPRTFYRDEEPIDSEAMTTEDFYFTDAISDHAADFVRQTPEDKPLFAYVAYTAPHWPLHAPDAAIDAVQGRYDTGWDELRERRLARQRELGILPDTQSLSVRDPHEKPWNDVDDPAWETRRMEVYAAQIEIMDQGIGRVLQALRDTGRFDDTLIVFTSDNGGCAEEIPPGPESFAHLNPFICPPTTRDGRDVQVGNVPGLAPGAEDTYASYGRAWANLSNTPFRLYKRWVHEGGIASPLIASWPHGGLENASIVHSPAHIVDLVPTFASVAGVDLHDDHLTGVDLVPLWRKSERGDQRTLYWEHIGNAAIRRGNWKLVREYGLPWELYDVSTDRAEEADLAGEHPDLVAELSVEWETWAKRCGVIPWAEMLDIGNYRWAYPPPDGHDAGNRREVS